MRTNDKLENVSISQSAIFSDPLQYSIAISLKRIADCLEDADGGKGANLNDILWDIKDALRRN